MRRIASLTLLFAGAIELFTSAVLYVLPAGRVAYWTDYHLLGLDKTQWQNVHLCVGVLLILMAGLHLYYNWRPLLRYLAAASKRTTLPGTAFWAALVITFYVVVGSVYNLPPMASIVTLGTFFSDRANRTYGEPPYGHAELSSLKMFARRINLDLIQVKTLLAEAGIVVTGDDQTILEIAHSNSVTPQQLSDVIQPAAATDNTSAFPDAPAPGFGMKTLRQISSSYGLNEQKLLKRLAEKGIVAAPEDSVKEIASKSATSPMAIFEQIREFSLEQE